MNWFEGTESKWIKAGIGDAAPCFFAKFNCPSPDGVRVAICGLGYYELQINGRKVGDRELAPIVSIYDRRARYHVLDVADYLQPGENAVGVILGHGWYNQNVTDAWNFGNVSWRDRPKLRLEIRDAAGGLLLASGTAWQSSVDGPIVHTQLRNGEHYDARREFKDWPTCAFVPDVRWRKAALAASPGGILEAETAIPCRVVRTFEILGEPNTFGVYDIGTNVSGRCRITVAGTQPGAQIQLDYAERVTEDGDLSKMAQNTLVKTGPFQHEEYTLKGDGTPETWESRFTYHGFRYVKVVVRGEASIHKLDVREVRSDFDSLGSFESSSVDLNRLQELARVSYLANFVGIPTDCPHREKNGWTGDAQLASETGLYNFDSAGGYGQWVDTLRDCQRLNGALPGIAPSAGWGYNWGNGPNWDGALFVVPYNIWLFTGDDAPLRRSYDAMRLYLEFCDSMCEDDIVAFGLGDWCPPLKTQTVEEAFSTTAAYYGLLTMFSGIAGRLGQPDDAHRYAERAERVRGNFNRHFYNGGGLYANGCMTALGTPLYYGLCEDGERQSVVDALADLARREDCKAQFGILGAKHVPRALADNGHADLALRFFTQEAYPGWVNWLRRGAVSLWESWEGNCSRNHIMFGDLSAWFFRYAAGFRHLPENPGWRHIAIEPKNLAALDSVSATYRGYAVKWVREGGSLALRVTVPPKCRADVTPPGGKTVVCDPGEHVFG
ncbi:MAG: family 78 glycoside hydrolase catalytic domain [Lentisphaerae bacterium]|nr:family 78 glycoside hydrolase catalytic domain [Lentisphaerota bacterium]